jgi:hypothetical protein
MTLTFYILIHRQRWQSQDLNQARWALVSTGMRVTDRKVLCQNAFVQNKDSNLGRLKTAGSQR